MSVHGELGVVEGAEDDLADLPGHGVKDEEEEDSDQRQQQQQHQDAPVPAPDEDDEGLQQVHKPVEGSFGAAAGEQVVSDEEETLSCLHYRHPRPLPRIWPASCAPHSLGLLQGLRLLAPLPHWPFLSLLHSQQLKLCLNLSLEKKGQKPSSWAASGRPSHPSHPRSCLP